MNATSGLEWVKIGTSYYAKVGENVIMNTAWPIEHHIHKSGSGWIVHRRVSNGICHGGSVHFRTLRMAKVSVES